MTGKKFKYSLKGSSDQIMGELKTQSGIDLKSHYEPQDVADIDYQKEINESGEFPYTGGAYRDMYRHQLWVRGLIAGCMSMG